MGELTTAHWDSIINTIQLQGHQLLLGSLDPAVSRNILEDLPLSDQQPLKFDKLDAVDTFDTQLCKGLKAYFPPSRLREFVRLYMKMYMGFTQTNEVLQYH